MTKKFYILGLFVLLTLPQAGFSSLSCSSFLRAASPPEILFTQASLSESQRHLSLTINQVTVQILDMSSLNLLKKSPSAVYHAALAAQMIYLRDFKSPYPIKIELHDFIPHPDNPEEKLGFSGGFYPKDHIVRIGLTPLSSNQKFFGLTDNLPMTVAHEITHLVQTLKGETLLNSLTNENYDEDPYEKEAWENAMDVYKFLNPYKTVEIQFQKTSFTTPEKSSFTDTWFLFLRTLNKMLYERYKRENNL